MVARKGALRLNSGDLGDCGSTGMKNALRTGLVGILAIIVAAAAVIPCAADGFPSCPLVPTGVSVSTRLDDAPPSLVRALTERVGEIAPAGAPIDVTDLVRIGKNRRLIFIWSKESRWIVATEHGGRVWNYPVFAFDIDRDHNAILVRTEAAAVNTVCATA